MIFTNLGHCTTDVGWAHDLVRSDQIILNHSTKNIPWVWVGAGVSEGGVVGVGVCGCECRREWMYQAMILHTYTRARTHTRTHLGQSAALPGS